MEPVLIGVMGPTASGKTAFAEALATELGAQLINADAFQIYRGMDIGTAKPASKDRYRLIDLKSPDEDFGLGEWVALAQDQIWQTYKQNQTAVFVGGTGLYVRALFESYDNMSPAPNPETRKTLLQRLANEGLNALVAELRQRSPKQAATIDTRNPVRVLRVLEKLVDGAEPMKVDLPPVGKIKFGLEVMPEELQQRVPLRVHQMVQNGWADEVANLRAAGFGPVDPGFRAIGYRAMWSYLEGELELDQAIATTIAETGAYAKRQRTWLRKEPNLVSLQAGSTQELLGKALDRLNLI